MSEYSREIEILRNLIFKVNSTKSDLIREIADDIKYGKIDLNQSLADKLHSEIPIEEEEDSKEYRKALSVWCFYHNIEEIIFDVDTHDIAFFKKIYFSKRELTSDEFYDFKEKLMNLITKYKINSSRYNLECELPGEIERIESSLKKVFTIIEDIPIFEDDGDIL